MPDALSVSPKGLRAASAALSEQAAQQVVADSAQPSSSKASAVGAARVSEAIGEFVKAYANRLADRGRSAEMAAASYTSADEDGAARITSVSV